MINNINELEDKNHVVLSIDEEEVIDKIQQAFMKKGLERVWRRGNKPQHSKGYVTNPQQHLS